MSKFAFPREPLLRIAFMMSKFMLNIFPGELHLNDGHCAFSILEEISKVIGTTRSHLTAPGDVV